MGRAPCCDKANVKKGPWSPEEDAKLKEYIEKHGTGGNWIALPQKAGLKRCGKSCRLRWLNYLRPNIKHGEFSEDEDRIICNLFASIGSRWSIIAAQLPGRTDNDIKNYWNTKLKKKMMDMNASAQGKPHQAMQNSASSYSSPSTFRDSTNSYYCHPHMSFQGFSSSSLLSGNSSNPAANSIFVPQDSFIGPIQNQQVLNMVPGEAASCSSSDGSSNINQISHVKAELVYGGDGTLVQEIGCMDNYTDSLWTEKQCGLWGGNPLDYGLEEIKQLSSNSCSNFLFNESKTEERVVYYDV